MKQFEIINIYKTLETLADNTNLSKKDQWALYGLRKFLRPHAEFQDEQEEKIREKYREFANAEGILPEDKSQEFIKDLTELNMIEKDLEEFEKIKIPIVEGINFKIMEPLEDFIEFTEPVE